MSQQCGKCFYFINKTYAHILYFIIVKKSKQNKIFFFLKTELVFFLISFIKKLNTESHKNKINRINITLVDFEKPSLPGAMLA